MGKKEYLDEITNRMSNVFKASKEGYKIPDIERHRLEGFMHAGIFMKIVTSAEMSELLDDIHYSIFGKTIQERKSEKSANWSDIEIDYTKYYSPTFLR